MEKTLTHTSPSGTTYTVVVTPQERTAYLRFMDSDSRYTEYYTQFSLFVNNKLATFCFSADEIPAAIDRYENPSPHIGSRFD